MFLLQESHAFNTSTLITFKFLLFEYRRDSSLIIQRQREVMPSGESAFPARLIRVFSSRHAPFVVEFEVRVRKLLNAIDEMKIADL